MRIMHYSQMHSGLMHYPHMHISHMHLECISNAYEEYAYEHRETNPSRILAKRKMLEEHVLLSDLVPAGRRTMPHSDVTGRLCATMRQTVGKRRRPEGPQEQACPP